MQTTSVMLQNLCVPCSCHCRYCLLSWSGQLSGLDYDRSAGYAERFYNWLKASRPDLSFNFSFGYSMDHPDLFRAIDFLRSLNSVGAEYLPFDGMGFRDEKALASLLAGLKEHGVKHLNFTFYGLKEYHDRFAGRQGDFDYMLRMIRAARQYGLFVSAGIPLFRENARQIEELLDTLEEQGAGKLTLFVPHEEGRGLNMNGLRFRAKDYQSLSDRAKRHFRSDLYRTEAEWVSKREFKETPNRALLISLTAENINRLETTPFDELIAWVEELDERYYEAIPGLSELADLYGDPDGQEYYQQRDLFHHYQRRYIQETGLTLYDVTDERQCGSRRY